MADILHLSDQTSQRIAAGEVVERPASVIKELVENAMDAGSTAITVEIRDGGIAYMRVSDNGCGIPPEQAGLAFQRHATSKIRDLIDLEKLTTLGFRGEALYATAAVSRVEMTTRTDLPSGVRVKVEGGVMGDVMQAGCPAGTTIEVRDLFYNTPARLKFLKKPSSEAGAIGEIMLRLMLSNPHISFRYINQGKMVFHSPGNGVLLDAVYCAFGKETAQGVLAVEEQHQGIRVFGFVGKPELSRGNRGMQIFFVNKRHVRNNLIASGLEKGCATRMPPGRHAFAVLFLEMPPGMVDVNVHPHKTEIRFAAGVEDMIAPIVAQAVTSALAESAVGSLWTQEPQKPEVVVEPVAKPETSHKLNQASEAEYRPIAPLPVPEILPYSPRDGQPVRVTANKHRAVQNSHAVQDRREDKALTNNTAKEPEIVMLSPPDTQAEIPIPFSSQIRVIGQVFSTYLLVQQNDVLWVVDQHAAHERILYERFYEMQRSGEVLSQRLLVPEELRLTPLEMEHVETNMPFLRQLGFELEVFGPQYYRIHAVPLLLSAPQSGGFFRDWLDGLTQFQREPAELKQEALIRMACRAAVKGGDGLNQSEIIALLERVRDEHTPLTCPHGRPILVNISLHDLERRFKRV